MCGIVCIVNKHGAPVERSAVEQAVQAMHHRGPDSRGIYCRGSVALGIARLSIVDLLGGDQPLFNEDRSKVLVYNGEIYNHRALRQDLEEHGHRFSTASDGEVILHLYEHDPENFISRLDGMFAFVLYDEATQRMLIGRDRIGIKPLLIFDDDEWFIAASEAKAIFASGVHSAQLNQHAIWDFFTFGYIPGRATAFEGVHHFPPARLAVRRVTDGTVVRDTAYWWPEFPDRRESNHIQYGKHVRGIRQALEESVAAQTIGDVPIGSYLSGGIDSTAVAPLLKRVIDGTYPIETYSIRFVDEMFNESQIFEETIRRCGLQGHILDSERPRGAQFSDVIFSLEQPQSTPLDVPMFRLSDQVRKNGRKVVLTGEGSDELFGGYLYFVLNQIRRLGHMPSLQPFRGLMWDKVLRYYFGEGELKTELAQIYMRRSTEIESRFGTYPAWYPVWVRNEAIKKSLFCEAFPDSLGEGCALQELCQPLKDRYRRIDDYNRSIWIELKTRLPNYILARTDKNSMAHSVEARVPFLSNAMIDTALQVPPLLKLFGVREKFILRRALRRIVPKHVLKRRKFGFDAPNRWLWENPDEYTRDLMSDGALRHTKLFNGKVISEIQRKLPQDLAKLLSPKTERDMQILTQVFTVQILYDRFVR